MTFADPDARCEPAPVPCTGLPIGEAPVVSVESEQASVILRIEHPVTDFDNWKMSFDADPLGREASGVLGYRVMRAADDGKYVLIDLEFRSAEDATAMLGSLEQLWGRVTGTLITDPKGRIVEVVERTTY